MACLVLLKEAWYVSSYYEGVRAVIHEWSYRRLPVEGVDVFQTLKPLWRISPSKSMLVGQYTVMKRCCCIFPAVSTCSGHQGGCVSTCQLPCFEKGSLVSVRGKPRPKVMVEVQAIPGYATMEVKRARLWPGLKFATL